MNKPYSTLFLLALAIALAVGCVILQEQAAALKSAEAEEVYHPELRDAYNSFGLPNQQSLSNRKLFEGNGRGSAWLSTWLLGARWEVVGVEADVTCS